MTADAPEASIQVRAVLCDCIRFDAVPAHAEELRERIAAVGWDELFAHADRARLGSVLVRAVERLGLAPQIPALTLPDGRMTVTAALGKRQTDHLERRRVLGERLVEIAEALDRAGIVPLALKGGRSIVTGWPDWRYLRDLDLLIEPRRAVEAQEIVMRLGYRPSEAPRPRLVHHHLHELYREDMPGWIEIHRRAGPSRVEQFLSTREMRAAALPSAMGVSVLPPHLAALHGMVHHHVGHRAVKHATIAPKGLYEFAAELMHLTAEERGLLVARASRHPRLLAIYDLWIAAADDLFGMPVASPFHLSADAAAWWQEMRAGTVQSGVSPELRAALQPGRMRRVDGGESPIRRAYWRLSMPLSFIKRPMILPQANWRRGPAP